MSNLLTPTARLVLFSLEKTPGQTLEQLQASTGHTNINSLRDALRVLRAIGKVDKTPKANGVPSIYNLIAAA